MPDDAVDSTSAVIEALVEHFAPLLRATARRFDICDEEAEELEQDVRIRLWQAIAHGVASPSASYCQRVVITAAADITRRRRCGRVSRHYGVDPATCSTLGAECMVSDPGPEVLVERQELAGEIELSIAALAPPRGVVVRLYAARFGRLEIAQLLEWSEPKVRNLLYRGLSDLRVALAQRGVVPNALP